MAHECARENRRVDHAASRGACDVLRGERRSRTSKKKKGFRGSRLRLDPARARRAPLARRRRRVHRERVRGLGVADEARKHAARRARNLGHHGVHAVRRLSLRLETRALRRRSFALGARRRRARPRARAVPRRCPRGRVRRLLAVRQRGERQVVVGPPSAPRARARARAGAGAAGARRRARTRSATRRARFGAAPRWRSPSPPAACACAWKPRG